MSQRRDRRGSGGRGRGRGKPGSGGRRRPSRNRRAGGNRSRGSGPVGPPPEGEPDLDVFGVLQGTEAGHGFLRSAEENYNPTPEDPIVPKDVMERWALEPGLEIRGRAIADPKRRAPWVRTVEELNGRPPEERTGRTPFKSLVDRIRLEHRSDEITTRVVDLIAPIGKGQRCLIVAPPKAGKTVLLQNIAHAITENHPEIRLIVLHAGL